MMNFIDNAIDNAIAFFSPKKAAERALYREHFKAVKNSYQNYGANQYKNNTRGWHSSNQSPNEDIIDNLQLLRARSRDLYSGGGLLGAGALKTIQRNVVGTGLVPYANIDYKFLGITEQKAIDFKNKVDVEFKHWAESYNCDATRMNNFYELQSLAFLSVLLSGDVFATLPMIKRPGSVYDLCIYLIEGDYVCDPQIVDFSKDILEGVEVGEYGEPIAYYVAKFHPKSKKNLNNEWKKIEPFGKLTGRRNLIHLMSMERPNQRRGIPLLSPVIETIKQLGRYTDAELTAAVISGMFSVFIKTEDPDNPLGESSIPYDQQVAKDDATSYELGVGTIMALEPNQSIEIANPSRPNTAFDGFVKALARQIGSAIELPYEVLVQEFTSSYSASRAALLEAWRMFSIKRDWLAKNFCQPIYDEWLTEAILKGRIEAKNFFADPVIKSAWCSVRWVGMAQGQIDPIKEVQAAKMRVEECFSTREEEAAALTGNTYDKVVVQRAKEEKVRLDNKLITNNNNEPIGLNDTQNNKA